MYPLSRVPGALPEEVAAQLSSLGDARRSSAAGVRNPGTEEYNALHSLVLDSNPPGRSNARPQGT